MTHSTIAIEIVPVNYLEMLHQPSSSYASSYAVLSTLEMRTAMMATVTVTVTVSMEFLVGY
jgi:hypothetical protein